MKYFLFPVLAQAFGSSKGHENRGKYNIVHQKAYDNDDVQSTNDHRQETTWVLFNDGKVDKYATIKRTSQGLAKAFYDVEEHQTVMVNPTGDGILKGELLYEVGGEERFHPTNKQQLQAAGEAHYADGSKTNSLVIAHSTLATAYNGGLYNKATQPYGSANGRFGAYSNCDVLAVFKTDNTDSKWNQPKAGATPAVNNAQNGGVGAAVGIVLYTKTMSDVYWTSDGSELCKAAQAANRELSKHGNREYLGNGYHGNEYSGKKDHVGRVSGEKEGLSGGAIAGIVLGSIAFVALVIVLVFCFCCKGDSGASSI